MTVFLNIKGRLNDVSQKLKAFLNLVSGKTSDDEFVKKLERKINEAKHDLRWRQEYMLSKFERNANIEEGIAIGEERGIVIGKERAFNAAINFMKANGMTDEQIENFRTSQQA